MSVSLDPSSGGNWWLARFTVGVSALLGVAQYGHHCRKYQHDRSLRFHSRQKALKAGQLTPGYFMLEQLSDDYSPQQIEQQLRSWGGKWDGVLFANSSHFQILPLHDEKGRNISTYELAVRKSYKRLRGFGLRAGATAEGMTIDIETNASETEAVDSLMPNHNMRRTYYQWSPPNPVYNIASKDRDEWERFTITIPDKPFIETTRGQIVLPLVSAVGSVLIYSLIYKIIGYIDWGKLLRRPNRSDNLSGGSS